MGAAAARGEGVDRRAALAVMAGLAAVRAVQSVRMGWLLSLPDELGFLGDARLLGRGRPVPDMVYAPIYKVGYPVLLAPLAAAFGSPRGLQVAAIVVNALLVAALVPVLCQLLGHLEGGSGGMRLLVATAAASLPAVWVAVPLVRPDGFTMLLLPLGLLALWALARPGPGWTRVWFGPAMAWLWVSHDRFLPLLVVAVLVLVLRAIAPAAGQDRRPDLVNLALLVAVAVGGWALDRWVVQVRWDQVIPATTTGLGVGDAGAIAKGVLGQWWYLVASTYGLAGVGVGVLVQRSWRAARRGRALWTEPSSLVGAVAVLALLGTQVAAAVQLRGATDLDLAVNGRYQDVAVPLLVAVGLARTLAWLADARHLLVAGASAGAVVILGLAVQVTRPPTHLIETAAVSGVGWGLERTPGTPLLGASFVAIVGIGLLVPLGRFHPRALAAFVLVAFTLAGLHETERVVDRSQATPPVVVMADRVRAAGVGPVAIDRRGVRIYTASSIAWELADVATPDAASPAGGVAPIVVTAATADGRQRLVPAGSRLLAVAGGGDWAAWARPGPTQDALARRGLLYPADPARVPGADRHVGLRLDRRAVRVTDGRARVRVTVANLGRGSTWPAPLTPGRAQVAVVVRAVGGPALRVVVPELRPGESATVPVELAALAATSGTRTLTFAVAQADGRPFTTDGPPPTLTLTR